MMAIDVDPASDEAIRRRQLLKGASMVLEPTRASEELCFHGAEMLREAFSGLDPRSAQLHLGAERCRAILTDLEPCFSHDPHSKELVQALLAEVGCDLERTYFELPRIRTWASNRLTSAIAGDFDAHRGSPYPGPRCEVNWWLPIFAIEERKVRPGAILLFGPAGACSSLPSDLGIMRCSIDFRTVNRDDLHARVAGPNIDSTRGGPLLTDLHRAADLSPLPKDLVEACRPRAEVVVPAALAG